MEYVSDSLDADQTSVDPVNVIAVVVDSDTVRPEEVLCYKLYNTWSIQSHATNEWLRAPIGPVQVSVFSDEKSNAANINECWLLKYKKC